MIFAGNEEITVTRVTVTDDCNYKRNKNKNGRDNTSLALAVALVNDGCTLRNAAEKAGVPYASLYK